MAEELRTYKPTVTVKRGKVLKGSGVLPDTYSPADLEAVIEVKCDDQVYRLARLRKYEHRQEFEDEYAAIIKAGYVQAQGYIMRVDEEGRVNIDVDHWGPADTESPAAAPAEASEETTITLPVDANSSVDRNDCKPTSALKNLQLVEVMDNDTFFDERSLEEKASHELTKVAHALAMELEPRLDHGPQAWSLQFIRHVEDIIQRLVKAREAYEAYDYDAMLASLRFAAEYLYDLDRFEKIRAGMRNADPSPATSK